jgi:hypothetical protein
MRPENGNETGAACTGFRQQTEQVMSQPTPSLSTDACTWLPRHRLTHIFRVVSRVDACVNGAIESRIVRSKGRVEQWSMVRRVGVLEHKIIVVGLSESQARLLRDGIGGLEGNLRSNLEHLFTIGRNSNNRS